MAAPVYSRPFIRTKGLAGDGDLVVVPAGYVYVVKFLSVYGNAGLDHLDIAFKHASTDQILWFQHIGLEERDSRQLACTFAFFNTESFRFVVGSDHRASADVFAGGYQLTQT